MPDADRNVHDLEKLLEIVRAMTVEKDLDRLLSLIISSTTDVLDAERSSLFLYDEKTKELYSRIAEKSEIGEIRFPADRGLAGEAAQKLCSINISDAYSDPRFNRSFDEQTGFRTRSVLCLPLLTHEDRLIGVIEVLNSRKGGFDEHDEELLSAFSTHAAIALDSARLIREYLEKKEIEQSLQLARRIQKGLFPKGPPAIDGFELAGESVSADDTGGDYYDYIQASNGSWAVVVGDVTGHGVGPALLMAATRSYLRALIKGFGGNDHREINPGDLLCRINNILEEDLSEGRFVTLFLAMLDPKSRRFTYASAGHENALYLPAASRSFTELEATGIPLGILADASFEEGTTLCLAPGDIVVLTTDGVAEAVNTAREPFGRERLRAAITQRRTERARGVLNSIAQALEGFRAGARQTDDQTIVVLRAL